MTDLLDALGDPARLAVIHATGLLDAPIEPALERLTTLATRVLEVPAAVASLVDGSRQFVAAQTGLPAEIAAVRQLPLSHSLCRHVVQSAAPLIVEDARHEPLVRDDQAAAELGVVAYAGFPLVVDGQVLGSFCAIGLAPRRWSARDLWILEELAAIAAGELALRARRHDDLVRDALDSSVLRALPDMAVLRFDRSLTVTFAEGGALSDNGWEPHMLLDRRLADVLPAKAYATLKPRYDAIISGQQVSFDFTMRSGGVWWCQGAPTRDATGALTGGSLIMREVSEQRRREAEVADSERRYRLLAERSTDVISRHDPEGRYEYVSPAAEGMFGFSPDQLLGRSAGELIHPDDREASARNHGRLLEIGGPATAGYRVVRADGAVIHVESTASAIQDEQGGVVELQCTTRDVTARHEAEAEKRLSDRLNATLIAAMDEGIIVRHVVHGIETCNASAERILGAEPGALIGTAGSPAGWRVFDESGSECPSGEQPADRALQSGQPQLGVVLALERPDGTRIWVRLSAVPLANADGSMDRVLITIVDISELREAERLARHRADHDPLTGLPNRTALTASLDQALADRSPDGRSVAALFIDIDHFKVVNDSLGHYAGDALLCSVADRLKAHLRHKDVLGRFGGDELIVLCTDVDGVAGARRLARRLLKALHRPMRLGGVEHVVSACVGVSLVGDESTAESMLREADAAMYAAKRHGPGSSMLFEPAMHDKAVAQLSMAAELRAALAGEQFELHYQPLYSLPERSMAGMEALVRWRHPTRGLVPPNEFIPIAESSGLIHELGDWVLATACRQLAEWRAAFGDEVGPMCVNLSAAQLASAGLPHRISTLMHAGGLPPGSIALELTESLLANWEAAGRGTITQLCEMGIPLMLDDFGTGYSSLSRLRHLPMTTIKVDRSFINDIATSDASRAVVAAVGAMAQAMNLTVVAEGVETEAQLALVAELGCQRAQGFLLARPMPAAELTALLRSQRAVDA